MRNAGTKESQKGRDYDKPSVLLDTITYMIRASGRVVDRLGNSLAYHAGSGRTYVEVKGLNATTTDKREISNVVLIRTKLENYTIEDRGMALMNTLASLGAMVHEGNSERVSIVSRLSAFRGDHDSWRLYLPLI